MDSVAHERLTGAGVDGDVATANRFQYAQAILGRVLERRIAVDGAHAQQVDLGVVRGEEKRKGVLGTGSDGIEKTRERRRTSCPGCRISLSSWRREEKQYQDRRRARAA